ncbi:MAG: hypothetical protein OXB84_09345 [Halobacteriovoraceae bacterium]|nr:hypothetical protein [Halobacteriovoraceae bacterium]
MGRRNYVETYNYQCSLTGETFSTTKKASKPEELISIKAYYQLNPEKDDRPEVVKMQDQEEKAE